MEITQITPTQKGRYALFADGAFLFSVHPDILAAAHLKVGDQLTVERLEELRVESEFKITKERALRLLGTRSYTAAQLRERLERYAEPDIAAQTVERMEELGLIDDEQYALACARDLLRLKGYAPRRIYQELCRRGIAQWMAQEAVNGLEEDQSDQRLLELVRRKYGKSLGDPKGKQRAFQGLARLGYGYEEIRRAIAQVLEEDGLEEE